MARPDYVFFRLDFYSDIIVFVRKHPLLSRAIIDQTFFMTASKHIS